MCAVLALLSCGWSQLNCAKVIGVPAYEVSRHLARARRDLEQQQQHDAQHDDADLELGFEPEQEPPPPLPAPRASSYVADGHIDTLHFPCSRVDSDEPSSLQRLVRLLDSAEFEIVVCMYSYTHTKIHAAIVRAVERGVKVAFVCDHSQALRWFSRVRWLPAEVCVKYTSNVQHTKVSLSAFSLICCRYATNAT